MATSSRNRMAQFVRPGCLRWGYLGPPVLAHAICSSGDFEAPILEKVRADENAHGTDSAAYRATTAKASALRTWSSAHTRRDSQARRHAYRFDLLGNSRPVRLRRRSPARRQRDDEAPPPGAWAAPWRIKQAAGAIRPLHDPSRSAAVLRAEFSRNRPPAPTAPRDARRRMAPESKSVPPPYTGRLTAPFR